MLFVFFTGLFFSGKAQKEYFIAWDKLGSAPAMAENILTTHKLISDFENKHIKATYWDESNFKGKVLGIGFRLSKTLLFDIHLDFLLHTNQHLIFGSGYRLREFGFTQNNYNIFMFPPYGVGGGFARKGINKQNRLLGQHENVTLEFGGVEAVSILSQKLKNKGVLRGSIDYRESLLYLSTLYEVTVYSVIPELFSNLGQQNYSVRYTNRVNNSFGFFNEAAYPLSHEELAKRSLVNFLNTYHFFAIYTYAKEYLLEGKESFDLPMIPVGQIKWLPAVRFGLSPFGTEFILENDFLKGDHYLKLGFRKGDGKLANYWGLGINLITRINDQLQLEGIYNFWNQPSLNLGGTQIFNTKGGSGTNISMALNYHFKKSPTGIYTQIGYKTPGYLEGERLNKGLILRLGLSFKLSD